MNISNRDIKLENALLDTDTTPRPLLRLCDFGYSINESLSLAKTAVGTQVHPGSAPSELGVCPGSVSGSSVQLASLCPVQAAR